MSGARIELDIDTKRAAESLDRAAASLDGDSFSLLLEDIGEYLVRATRDSAELEVSPDGRPWPALSPRYAQRKRKKHPGAKMLHLDFHMLGDQLSAQVDGSTLYVGTSAKYGAIQQFGGTIQHAAYGRVRDKAIIPAHETTIPARPWLGVNADDEREIAQLTLDHIRMALDEAE